MDAARRREIRKRKVLQNAEDRIRKVTNVHEEPAYHGSLEPPVFSANGSCSKSGSKASEGSKLKYSAVSANSQTDGKYMKSSEQEVEGLSGSDCSQYKKADYQYDQTDGLNEESRQYKNVRAEQRNVTGTQDTEKLMKTTKLKLRIVVVMMFATLCYFESSVLPFLGKTTGLDVFEFEEHSFIIPFCLMELFLLCVPSLRKVVPGKKINLWLLAFKLCGVSPTVLQKLEMIVLETLEFLTDLAIFIFVLVILHNLTEV